MIRGTCFTGALLVLILAAFAASPQPATPTARPPAIDPARRAEVSKAVLSQARESLAAADFVAARDRFLDVLEADRNSVEAMHGIALACAALGDKAKATDMIENAIQQLERTGKKPDRPLLLNFCMVQISNRNTMRAVKYLVGHLTAHSEPLDESVINALGAALWNSAGTARTGTLWAGAEKLYTELNAKLEAQNPGKKRWGVRWVSPAEHARLQREWDKVGAAWDKAQSAWAEYVQARKHHSNMRSRRMIGAATVADVNNAASRVNAARNAYDQARADYKQKFSTIDGPDFPEALVAVPMDELRPAEASQIVTALTSEQTATLRPQRTVTRRGVQPDTTRAKPPVVKPPVGAKEKEDEPGEMEAPPPPPVVVPRQAGKRSVTRVAGAFPVAAELLVTSADAVAGAREVQVSDLNGEAYKATVVRSDAKTGLALVRASGMKLPPLKVAAAFKGGPVKCVSFAPLSIFDLKPDLISGGIRLTPDGPVLSLQREPRRSGTPLISGSEVVGVSVADRGANPADLPLASLDELRAFLGDDASAAGPFGVPEQVICELTATVEVE